MPTCTMKLHAIVHLLLLLCSFTRGNFLEPTHPIDAITQWLDGLLAKATLLAEPTALVETKEYHKEIHKYVPSINSYLSETGQKYLREILCKEFVAIPTELRLDDGSLEKFLQFVSEILFPANVNTPNSDVKALINFAETIDKLKNISNCISVIYEKENFDKRYANAHLKVQDYIKASEQSKGIKNPTGMNNISLPNNISLASLATMSTSREVKELLLKIEKKQCSVISDYFKSFDEIDSFDEFNSFPVLFKLLDDPRFSLTSDNEYYHLVFTQTSNTTEDYKFLKSCVDAVLKCKLLNQLKKKSSAIPSFCKTFRNCCNSLKEELGPKTIQLLESIFGNRPLIDSFLLMCKSENESKDKIIAEKSHTSTNTQDAIKKSNIPKQQRTNCKKLSSDAKTDYWISRVVVIIGICTISLLFIVLVVSLREAIEVSNDNILI